MKKIIYSIVLFPVLVIGQTQSMNYIKSTTYKQPTTTSITSPTILQANQNITYFDGLGNPIQQISSKQSATGKNIVQHIEYDALGRQVKEFLPYTTSTDGLDYESSAASDVLNYPKYAGEIPYGEKLLEASPLQRVMEIGAPGNNWALSSDHKIRNAYSLNSSNEVKYYKANSQWISSLNLYDISFVDNGFYAEGSLYKTIVKNVNWKSTDLDDNTTHEFKDNQGNVVLIRRFENNVAHDTFYVYDQFGNLIYVIPPLVQNASSELDALCYQYKYDRYNRQVAKKLPGKQWEFVVYDKLNRPVATGPVKSPWGLGTYGVLISEYDVLGRVTQSGWRELAMSETARSSWQNNIASGSNPFVLGTNDLLTKNYYDNYSFPNAPTIPSDVENEPVATNVKSMATGSWIRILTTPTELKGETSYVLYDTKYRPIRNYVANYLGGYTQTDTKLDFAGKTLYTITKHKKASSDTEIKITDTFEYTEQGRLLLHKHQINNDPEKLITKNTYDELGQLITKKVGGDDLSGDYALQKVDYSYNIKGWLKSINDVNGLLSSDLNIPDDLFALKINYNDPVNSRALYDGNISEIFWRTYLGDVLRKYDYQYDNLNRLRASGFSKPDVANYTDSYREEITYDNNGNIQHLLRNGGLESDTYEFLIDDLTYEYHPTNKNQLMKVTDASLASQGFDDGNTTGDDYEYDADGNMTKDLNKKITSNITYNHLNLPVKIVFNNNEQTKIEYIYNASGVKVSKKVNYIKKVIVSCGGGGGSTSKTTVGFVQDCYNNVPTTDITNYLAGGFQYLNNVLQFFPHAEGYVKNEQSSYLYVYNFTDHLGNVRLSYYDDGGYPSILEENNYYPFGLKHEGYNYTDNTNNKYKYNGKELQDELGLNFYDYGARNFDPALGRWMNIDPLAEASRRFSPYTYANNNPIFFVDPDGRFTHSFDSMNPNDSPDTFDGKMMEDFEAHVERLDCDTCPKNGKIGDTHISPGGHTYENLKDGGWTQIGNTLNEVAIKVDMSNKTNFENFDYTANLLSLSSGVAMGFSDIEKYSNALKNNSFIYNYKGSERIWKQAYTGGNTGIPYNLLNKAKIDTKVLGGLGNGLKIGGNFLAIASILSSEQQYRQGIISNQEVVKNRLDSAFGIVMPVASLGGIPGNYLGKKYHTQITEDVQNGYLHHFGLNFLKFFGIPVSNNDK